MSIALVLLPAQLILAGLEVKLILINCIEFYKFINYCDLIKEVITFSRDLDTAYPEIQDLFAYIRRFWIGIMKPTRISVFGD